MFIYIWNITTATLCCLYACFGLKEYIFLHQRLLPSFCFQITSSNNMSKEISELKKRIYQLEQLVQKQNKIITKTGQNVLELQVDKQRQSIGGLASTSTYHGTDRLSRLDTTDFVTNDDIVQLVGELQIELNNIEERSIRRMINANKSKPTDILAPLPNPDGETPTFKPADSSYDFDFFPRTVNDFVRIDDLDLIKLAKFYECVPPTLNDKLELDKFLDEKIDSLSSSNHNKTFSNDVLITDEKLKTELKSYSRDQLDDIFNDVARYLGLPNRRGTDVW